MNITKTLLTILLGTLLLFSPLVALAGAVDTLDGCPVGQTAQGGGCVAVGTTNPAAGTPTNTSCTGTFAFMSSPFTCMWRTGTSWLAASLIWVAVTIMVWVGWLFDLAISQTVIGFNAWITGDVLNAIGIGWSFFRDVANIVIIGLFVFIAIGIILGLKEYGQKKLIARVLIVAVLINFSFLFTRIVINFSNAIAVQFAQPLGASPGAAGAAPPDIAGKFTDLMGVKTWSNTKNALADIAQKNDSSWIALMHAFLVIIVALGVAIVLLYGSILLIARALIFIFLMVTSSLAFATYLLPSFASSEFGWKAWWTALFRNAMLAPIMMLFLVVTLKISNTLVAGLNPTGGTGTGGFLGALAANPDDPKNISALLIYIIILGLLYGSIRISNKFSGAAGQFALSGTLPFATAAFSVPARSIGFAARNTVGRGAAYVGDKLQERAKVANARNPGGMGQYTWDKLSQGIKQVAKRDFNAGNVVGGRMAQPKLGGFAGQQDRVQKSGLARQERNTYKDAELDKARKIAIEQARKENPDVAEKHDANKETLEAAKKAKEAAEAQLKNANANKDSSAAKLDTLKAKQAKTDDQGAKDAIQKEIDREQGEFKKAGNDIERAKVNAQAQSSRVVKAETDGKEFSDILEKRAQALMPKGMTYKQEVDEHGKTKTYAQRLGDNAVEDVFKRLSNIIPRTLGTSTKDNDKLSQKLRGMAKDHETAKEMKKVVTAMAGVKSEVEKLTEVEKKGQEKASDAAARTNEKLDAAAHKPTGGGDH